MRYPLLLLVSFLSLAGIALRPTSQEMHLKEETVHVEEEPQESIWKDGEEWADEWDEKVNLDVEAAEPFSATFQGAKQLMHCTALLSLLSLHYNIGYFLVPVMFICISLLLETYSLLAHICITLQDAVLTRSGLFGLSAFVASYIGGCFALQWYVPLLMKGYTALPAWVWVGISYIFFHFLWALLGWGLLAAFQMEGAITRLMYLFPSLNTMAMGFLIAYTYHYHSEVYAQRVSEHIAENMSETFVRKFVEETVTFLQTKEHNGILWVERDLLRHLQPTIKRTALKTLAAFPDSEGGFLLPKASQELLLDGSFGKITSLLLDKLVVGDTLEAPFEINFREEVLNTLPAVDNGAAIQTWLETALEKVKGDFLAHCQSEETGKVVAGVIRDDKWLSRGLSALCFCMVLANGLDTLFYRDMDIEKAQEFFPDWSRSFFYPLIGFRMFFLSKDVLVTLLPPGSLLFIPLFWLALLSEEGLSQEEDSSKQLAQVVTRRSFFLLVLSMVILLTLNGIDWSPLALHNEVDKLVTYDVANAFRDGVIGLLLPVAYLFFSYWAVEADLRWSKEQLVNHQNAFRSSSKHLYLILEGDVLIFLLVPVLFSIWGGWLVDRYVALWITKAKDEFFSFGYSNVIGNLGRMVSVGLLNGLWIVARGSEWTWFALLATVVLYAFLIKGSGFLSLIIGHHLRQLGWFGGWLCDCMIESFFNSTLLYVAVLLFFRLTPTAMGATINIEENGPHLMVVAFFAVNFLFSLLKHLLIAHGQIERGLWALLLDIALSIFSLGAVALWGTVKVPYNVTAFWLCFVTLFVLKRYIATQEERVIIPFSSDITAKGGWRFSEEKNRGFDFPSWMVRGCYAAVLAYFVRFRFEQDGAFKSVFLVSFSLQWFAVSFLLMWLVSIMLEKALNNMDTMKARFGSFYRSIILLVAAWFVATVVALSTLESKSILAVSFSHLALGYLTISVVLLALQVFIADNGFFTGRRWGLVFVNWANLNRFGVG